MKRLLQIGLDTLLLSIIPIIIWNIVGITFEKDLATVYALTYPVQFVFFTLQCLFASGANITAEKEKDKNIVYTNMVIGLIVGIIVLAILIKYTNQYITFFNADYNLLRNFTIYGMINIFYSYVLRLVLEKLYYEKENKKSNIISISFNLASLIIFTMLAVITKNQLITICGVLVILGIALVTIFLANMKKFTFKLKLKENLEHSSSGIISSIALALTYFIGMHNEFSFGIQYLIVNNFISLTTDAQWDMMESIGIAAKIDASKSEFNMKQSLKNSYQYVLLLIVSSVLMAIGLYFLYKPDMIILIITFAVQVVHLLLFATYTIRLSYIQTKPNEIKTNFKRNVLIGELLRTMCAFIYNPYCTYIGQLVAAIYQYIYTKFVSRKVKEIQ